MFSGVFSAFSVDFTQGSAEKRLRFGQIHPGLRIKTEVAKLQKCTSFVIERQNFGVRLLKGLFFQRPEKAFFGPVCYERF